MEPLLILVLRKVNPFNFSPLALSSFLNAFSLEFAQGAELVLLWTLNDWPKDLHEEAEINYSFRGFFPWFSVILCLEARLHPALPAGRGRCEGMGSGGTRCGGGGVEGQGSVCILLVLSNQPAPRLLSSSLLPGSYVEEAPWGKLSLGFFRLSTWRRKSGLRTDHPSGNPSLDF